MGLARKHIQKWDVGCLQRRLLSKRWHTDITNAVYQHKNKLLRAASPHRLS